MGIWEFIVTIIYVLVLVFAYLKHGEETKHAPTLNGLLTGTLFFHWLFWMGGFYEIFGPWQQALISWDIVTSFIYLITRVGKKGRINFYRAALECLVVFSCLFNGRFYD